MKTPPQNQTSRVGRRREVIIPKEILDSLKLRAGDVVSFAEQRNGVLITPKRVADPEDALTPAEARIVRRGEAQIERGESKPWRDVKHALSR